MKTRTPSTFRRMCRIYHEVFVDAVAGICAALAIIYLYGVIGLWRTHEAMEDDKITMTQYEADGRFYMWMTVLNFVAITITLYLIIVKL